MKNASMTVIFLIALGTESTGWNAEQLPIVGARGRRRGIRSSLCLVPAPK